jgi:hypothetical protein
MTVSIKMKNFAVGISIVLALLVIGFIIGLYFIGFGYLSTDEAKPLLLQNIEVQTINYEQNKIQSH